MCVSVVGSGCRVRDLVYDASLWGVNHLMPRMVKSLEITIKLKSNLLSKDGYHGDCIWEDSTYRPREYTIHLDSKQKKPYLIQTLMHELVHVKQWARGELKDIYNSSHLSKWNGVVYDTNVTNYDDLPWEIEAHKKETDLYTKWLNQSSYKNAKWVND